VRWSVLPVSVAALLVAAPGAQAHLMNSGFGPFYDGLAHPFVVAEDLIPVVALGLLAGLGGARRGRWMLFGLTLSWAVGMAVGSVVLGPAAPDWWTGGGAIVLGALVAADRRLPLGVVAGLAAVVGGTHGFGNGRELAGATGGALAMAGIVCALFALSSLLAGHVTSLKSSGARLVVRVAGSWVAAIGLLMLGWALR